MADGLRLRSWRERLPRGPQGHVISRGGLSKVLEWEPARWGKLEGIAQWSDPQREEVAEGVRAIAARLYVPASIADACVAHVLDGAPAPELGPWREGQCPAPLMGRPKGTGRPLRRPRVLPRERDDDPEPTPPGGIAVARPILPEHVRRAQVAAILRTVREGELDEDTALEAISDVYEPLHSYYNKLPRPDHDAA